MRRPTTTTRTRAIALLASAAVLLGVVSTGATAGAGTSRAHTRPARAAAPEATPVLKADYKFNGNRRSPSPAAPALFDIGNGGTSTFATENVDGVDRRVLRFPDGNGLQLIDANRVIPRNRYTIVVKFRFDTVDSFNRVIDFSRAVLDSGPYVFNGQFVLFSDDYDTVANIDADEWVNVVLTRSQAGRIRGYVDGTQVFDVTNPNAAKITDLNTLRFFRDNDNREETSGAVSRIRLYDNGMTPAQVAALGT